MRLSDFRSGPDDPQPLPWDEYVASIGRGWGRLLDSDPSEGDVQDFLERHPCLLPSPHGLFRGGHHGPFPAAVISQPLLPSYKHRQPDFKWLTSDSMSLWAVLIEIERPQKRWFREDTTQHSDLTQALDQLREWEVWFKDSTNVGSFLDFYDVPRWMTSRLQFRQHYVLIHGRRDEPSMNGLGKKRAAIEREGETLMTFDRLRPLEDLSDIITVVRDEHRYYAVHAQPTIDLNRFNVGDWRHVEGVEDVIAVDDRIADDRKDYLIEALHRGWAAMDKEDAERGRST